MSVIACYNVYNEREHIAESVASIYDRVQKITFVDGVYKEFYKGGVTWSTDGTLKWIRDKANDPKGKFSLITAPKGRPWESQAEKRTAYLNGTEGDIYFVLDAHEIAKDWKGVRLTMNVAGMARIDIPDNALPISVMSPRMFPHKRGLKYLTHAYMITESDGEQEFFLNLGWDQLPILPPKQFDEEVPAESYCVTLHHYGAQRKEMAQRGVQKKKERKSIEVFDHEHGLNHAIDSRVAVERTARIIHKEYRKIFIREGLVPIPYDKIRQIVELKAEMVAKQQHRIREAAGLKTIAGEEQRKDRRLHCPDCNRLIASPMHLITHKRDGECPGQKRRKKKKAAVS